MQPVPQDLDHRRDIDGLRAVAVVAVILFHAGFGFRHGYVGVDMFFVISGFLISSILIKEVAEGTYDLSAFWERRIRRILPASVVVVLVSFAVGWFIYLPHDLVAFGKSAFAQALLLSNAYFCRTTNYFSASAETKPLLHTWSLAVEEQFYLLFPPLFVFLIRRGRRAAVTTVALLAVGSLVLKAVVGHWYPREAFYHLPMRAWEMLLGVLLASCLGRVDTSPTAREAAGWTGLLLVVCSSSLQVGDAKLESVRSLCACAGTACIIFSSELRPSFVGRILAFRPFAATGAISYSLYLWHWPLLAFAIYPVKEPLSAWSRTQLLLVCGALATLSWKYIETPFRRKRPPSERGRTFWIAGTATATPLVLGLAVYLGDGFRSRFPPRVMAFADGATERATWDKLTLGQARSGNFPSIGSRRSNRPVEVLLIGDSHAGVLHPMIDGLLARHSTKGIMLIQSSKTPLLGAGDDPPSFFSQEMLKSVLRQVEHDHIKKVVLVARWARHPADDWLKSRMLATVQAFSRTGAKVYVVKDVPRSKFDVPRAAAFAALRQDDPEMLGIPRASHERAEAGFDAIFAEVSSIGATVLDPTGYLLDARGFYSVVRDGKCLYSDDNHLTLAGARLLEPLFDPVFKTDPGATGATSPVE